MIGSGCTGWAPNAARWFKASSIWGPWTYMGNPCQGEEANITYGGQSTYVLPAPAKKGEFIFMADIWEPKNPINGRYLWLPIKFQNDKMTINFTDEWNLSTFNK